MRRQKILEVVEHLSTAFPAGYAGHEVSELLVTVYVAAAGKQELERALYIALGPAATGAYEFVPVARSMAELTALTMQIADDGESALEAFGAKLVSWGPDIRSNTVTIRLTDYTAAAARYLEERYGAERVTVVPWSGGLPRRVRQ